MRLIDADALKKDLESVTLSNGTLLNTNTVLLLLDKYPTAYDVDKVVQRLDKASDYYECEEQGREHVQMIDLADAIEIVKAGGSQNATKENS